MADDLTLEDVDDCPSRSRPQMAAKGRPLSAEEERFVLDATFGAEVPLEWRNQSFEFSPFVAYGLLQLKGGPCGVLAVVQSHLLVRLFFGPNDQSPRECLSGALGDILWRIGDQRRVSVVSGHSVLAFTRLADIVRHVAALLDRRAFGVVAFLYSCLLTRDPRPDFDDTTQALIGRHHYCTQELVNWLLTGRAVSNVFDGTRSLGPDLRLSGVSRACRVGFLSLHEHYGDLQVGRWLKSAEHPVWVIQSESHFSVLFAKRPTDGARVNLFHWDGLADQRAEVALDVLTTTMEDEPPVGALEAVVRTRWPRARIEWRTERML